MAADNEGDKDTKKFKDDDKESASGSGSGSGYGRGLGWGVIVKKDRGWKKRIIIFFSFVKMCRHCYRKSQELKEKKEKIIKLYCFKQKLHYFKQ